MEDTKVIFSTEPKYQKVPFTYTLTSIKYFSYKSFNIKVLIYIEVFKFNDNLFGPSIIVIFFVEKHKKIYLNKAITRAEFLFLLAYEFIFRLFLFNIISLVKIKISFCFSWDGVDCCQD